MVKLTQITARYFALATALVLIVWAIVFFFVLRYQIVQSIDQALLERKAAFLDEPTLPQPSDKEPLIIRREYVIQSISEQRYTNYKPHFSDTALEVGENKMTYRVYHTVFDLKKNKYELKVLKARITEASIIQSVVIDTVAMFLLLLLLLLLLNRYLLTRTWKPFYELIAQLRTFDVRSHTVLPYEPSRIAEFDALSKAVNKLTLRSRRVFTDQKDFIENVTHEIQTPLAVIKSKLDIQIQDPNLTHDQALFYEELAQSIRKINKLNRSLLLLSKIENNHYIEKEELGLADVFDSTLDAFIPKIEFKHLEVIKRYEQEPKSINANRLLLEILFTNLIKNAIVHNLEHGKIEIEIQGLSFTMRNTGVAPKRPTHELTHRFKSSGNGESTGLGLSIVKQICRVNNYRFAYQFSDNWHEIAVNFN
jgi:signal transduction histidine kinase